MSSLFTTDFSLWSTFTRISLASSALIKARCCGRSCYSVRLPGLVQVQSEGTDEVHSGGRNALLLVSACLEQRPPGVVQAWTLVVVEAVLGLDDLDALPHVPVQVGGGLCNYLDVIHNGTCLCFTQCSDNAVALLFF